MKLRISTLLAVVVNVGVDPFGHFTEAGHVAVRDPVASCVKISIKLNEVPEAGGLVNVNVQLPVIDTLKMLAVDRSAAKAVLEEPAVTNSLYDLIVPVSVPLTVVVLVAPLVAEPSVMLVVLPETPAVPMLTALVVAVSVAPVAMFTVCAAVDWPRVMAFVAVVAPMVIAPVPIILTADEPETPSVPA